MSVATRGVRRPNPSTAPDSTPGWVAIRGLGWGLLVVSLVGAVLGAAWWLTEPRAQFMALGWAAALVVTVPLLSSRASLHSPWSLVVASVYIGCAFRGTLISIDLDGAQRNLNDLFLLGQPPGYFLGPSVLHLAGLIVLTGAYVLTTNPRSRGRDRRRPAETSQDPRSDATAAHRAVLGGRTPVVVAVFAVVGFIAFVLYARATGGFSLSSLSAKRTTINGLDLADDYASHGELRFLNGFAAAALWVGVFWSALRRRRGSKGLPTAVLVVLGLNAVLLPFYSSSRSEAAFIILVAAALHLAAGARFSRRALVGAGVTLLLVLTVMTNLRSSAISTRAEGGSLWTSLSESLVYNRNFGDMTNTAHIVRNVPRNVPYQEGATMLGYLVAPIPRSVWPEKPIISSGPLIGVYIYGTVRSGVPPGLFGDLYLNFGAGAVPLGGLLTGVLLGLVERWRRRLDLTMEVAMVLYCTIGLRVGLFAMNKGLAFAVFKSVMELVPVLVVMGACLVLSTTGVAPTLRRSRRKRVVGARR